MIDYFIVRIITHPIKHEMTEDIAFARLSTLHVNRNKKVDWVIMGLNQFTLEIWTPYMSNIINMNQPDIKSNHSKYLSWYKFCILQSYIVYLVQTNN